ncbi:dTDP-4-amino-4,6-dideoxygalactose transaminase [Paenibacillus radicis (ex Xue et al. 2023)]|uniref:dTDP-4-amino-4,6-dideoxygalactose transaminase n=1 Tax=Paenibacillus radicis (ex Xue et al. 2023) TaxID=2972489 RepID=A0ABT1YS44_9BACL|nr:dTDP-4-amino-4,6-dideoxygalactose transaminase [Paenibacillus radicis (ex Xue et al. 2023)]MCR8635986.1 dTDP-4-amino-4,6-dideoxygalactose transaminase [Paenibacillus radicis (ex Xue et al. 2023)]
MIPFNIPSVVGNEFTNISKLIESKKFCGDGEFTNKCNKWMEKEFDTMKALLTTSCTHALEMAAILAQISKDDEVIMPSYTFVSSANAFVLRGAKIKFVDIRPDTMNINERLIEEAITPRTKAIVPVHYAGVSCEMDMIMEVAKRNNLIIIEDAAQGVMSTYKGKALGTIGHLGCYSFHETKNYHCGEGGALLVNELEYIERSEIIREKGTDRSKFLRGQVDKYTWVDVGSSYLPSELNAAYLYAQFEKANEVNQNRLKSWRQYYEILTPLSREGFINLPFIPEHCEHNAHMFYIKTKNIHERTNLIDYLRKNNVIATFHYVPLHSSIAGNEYGVFQGNDEFTTKESERLLRLPFFYDLHSDQIELICNLIFKYYGRDR